MPPAPAAVTPPPDTAARALGSALGGAGAVAALALLLLHTRWLWREAGGDFLGLLSAAALLLDGRGAAMYDIAAVAAEQRTVWAQRGISDAVTHYVRPPAYALLFTPFAAAWRWLDAPMLPLALTWTALGLAAAATAALLLGGAGPVARSAGWSGRLAAAAGFAPLAWNATIGQTAALDLLALTIAMLTMRSGRNPWIPATAFAAMLHKTHLFVGIICYLLATRRGGVVARLAALGTAGSLASAALAGLDWPLQLGALLLSPEYARGRRTWAWYDGSWAGVIQMNWPELPALALAAPLLWLAALALLAGRLRRRPLGREADGAALAGFHLLGLAGSIHALGYDWTPALVALLLALEWLAVRIKAGAGAPEWLALALVPALYAAAFAGYTMMEQDQVYVWWTLAPLATALGLALLASVWRTGAAGPERR